MPFSVAVGEGRDERVDSVPSTHGARSTYVCAPHQWIVAATPHHGGRGARLAPNCRCRLESMMNRHG
jgi:hypothetical protein